MNDTVRQRTRISTHALKVRGFAGLSLLVTMLLTAYVALIGISVKNVVERKEAEVRTANIRAEVAQLEKEYLTRVSDLTEVRAEGMGLAKVTSKKFIERRILVGRAE